MLQRAELERYCALDEQRQKWEARETRLIARLEAVEEELGALGDSTSRAADNEHLKEQLRSLASYLQAVQSLVSSLTEQNHELERENKRWTWRIVRSRRALGADRTRESQCWLGANRTLGWLGADRTRESRYCLGAWMGCARPTLAMRPAAYVENRRSNKRVVLAVISSLEDLVTMSSFPHVNVWRPNGGRAGQA